MSRLAQLLNEPESKIQNAIEKLESLSGYNSEDVRLISEINQQTARKIASLGLDPADTTGEELFQTLQVKLKADSRHLARAFGFKPDDTADQTAQKLVALAERCAELPKILALKNSAIKVILRNHPPKKLMKKLGYRSLESMLKRQNPRVLLASAPATETSGWSKALAKDLAKLTAADYEYCTPVVTAMTPPAMGKAADRAVTYEPLSGVIAVWPAHELKKESAVYDFLLVLQAVEILEAESFYLSHHQFQADFGKKAASLFADSARLPLADELDKFDFQNLWRASKSGPTAFEKLASTHPLLSWWRDSGHLLQAGAESVSLNLADNLACLRQGLAYKERVTANAIHQLKSEILKRYGAYPGVQGHLAFEPAPAEDLTGELALDLV
ncbi:MAG TPA: hypothetical protein VFP35_03255 [Candidatus Saccharimonadales bacterium]|nr:hypothetical protein [Candidatus Saccharimonadales bacterium]